MNNKQEHWDNIFSTKQDTELGWHEDDLSLTLNLLGKIDISSNSTLFLAGAGTSKLVDELLKTNANLVINDISAKALEILSQRLGSSNCQYLHHDLGHTLEQSVDVDIWVDRAVLHFLLTEEQIKQYFDNLRASVKPGGYVLLAEFSNTGVTHCAGLQVHQYSTDEMQARLGEKFELITSKEYIFINPFKQERPYNYALFKRTA